MNDTKELDAKICINGLKELILDVLAEAGRKGLRIIDVRKITGIENQLDLEDTTLMNMFTRILLVALQEAKFVEKHGHGHGSYWTITDKGLEELRDRSNP